MRQLIALVSHPPDLWIALRTLGWMTGLPVLKRILALSRLVRLMHRDASGTVRDVTREQRIVGIVRRLCRVSGGNCLERSLILYRFLGEAGATPKLVMGIGHPDAYAGHVWVTIDAAPLLEIPETVAAYTELMTFDETGRLIS